jgi:hypothetical protein
MQWQELSSDGEERTIALIFSYDGRGHRAADGLVP